MQKQSTFYFFILLSALPHTSLSAGAADQKKQDALNKEFFEVAYSKEITPQEKYDTLKTLLDQKADVETIGVSKKDTTPRTALCNLMLCRLYHTERDETNSIKLLIDSKSPLNSTSYGHAPLRLAIRYPYMHSIVSMLVQAKVDVDLLPHPKNTIYSHTYLHDIAAGYYSDEQACSLFDTLSALGNVPINRHDTFGVTPLHISRLSKDRRPKKPKLVRRLLTCGANAQCPINGCECYKEDDAETKALYGKWDAEAEKRVLEKIPVRDLADIVMDYCFWDPKKTDKQ